MSVLTKLTKCWQSLALGQMAKLARGLAFLTCTNCFHLSPIKTSPLPMKLRHSTAKPCVIYELQDVVTLQAGQRITSQCKLICRCFAQYWKNNLLHYMCGCSCSALFLLGWLVRGCCFVFFFFVVMGLWMIFIFQECLFWLYFFRVVYLKLACLFFLFMNLLPFLFSFVYFVFVQDFSFC